MLQSRTRITALLIILSAGIAIPAAGAPKGGGGGGPPGHAAPAHAAPAARAAPAPHAAAPKAAAPAPAARAAAPRASAPQAARQRHAPAQASTPRAAPPTARAERRATPQAAPAAAKEQPQTTGRNRDAREQQKLVEPKPRDDAARQPREGGAGTGPAARAERNASPQNAPPPQPQAAQKFQSAGGKQAIAGGVLRNQTFANRSAAGDPNARALARATFQGRFFDPGWRRRYPHPIVIGWAGPLFWPYAYSDFADYTFYPYAYDTFWPYAYDDVYDGMFGSYARGYGGTYARSYDGSQARAGRRQRDSGTGRSISADLCSGQTAGLTDWPVERIAQTIEPNDVQRAALDELRGATAKALDVLQAACPTDLPSTPTGRIEAMHQRLAAMLQAVRIVRPAMEKLYQSLNDEQKARFNALGPDEGKDQQQRELSQVCGDRASGIASLPLDQIERAVRPDEPQRGALRALQDATAQAINQLQSDCPSYRALTPVARLVAMEQRLDAMLRAVETVQPALEKFYGALSDEQKERFNRLSPARG
jgi:LTXXQ motif family protein